MPVIRQIIEIHGPESPLIHQLASVFRAARQERLQFLTDLHDMDEDRQFLSRAVLPASQVWVAEVEANAVGFIAFADGWVNHLYVAPAFQHRGLGTRLLNIAKQSSSVQRLWVFEVNSRPFNSIGVTGLT